MDRENPLTWRDNGTPVSTRFDDPYFSADDGLSETRHVFLGGNDLPARLCDGFQVAELGFGTGLSFLTLWQAWLDSGAKGQIHFTSFEAFPLSQRDMAQALTAFPELAPLAEQLVQAWPLSRANFGPVTLTLWKGDARKLLPLWQGRADAWFLDGFSPAKNPELWEPALMQSVADHTAPGGTCATYTAAGHVRHALEDAGFEV
jgi:tRNA U34 5-methylaminomethyl-2-thiouridine-forming methyltransferase MnmC